MTKRILKVCILVVGVALLLVACGSKESTGLLQHRNDIEVTDCSYTVPEGMKPVGGEESYKLEKGESTLYMDHFTSGDSSDLDFFDNFNEDVCKKFEEQAMEQIYGEKIDVKVMRFDTFEIDGLPAYRYDINYTAEGVRTVYTMIMVGGDKIYNFSYEQLNTDTFSDVVEESVNSIRFEYNKKG